MKTEIVKIIEWYNSEGELVEQTIVYGKEETCGHFEQMPKKAEKWLERAKKSAGYINESKMEHWSRKEYKKECEKL